MYYTFTVKTANEIYAGTDSTIYFTLISAKGEKSVKMATSEYIKGNAYQQGDLDSFCINFEGFDERAEKLIIETNAKSSGSDWKCSYVKVYSDTHCASVFSVEEWIKKAKNDYTYTAEENKCC